MTNIEQPNTMHCVRCAAVFKATGQRCTAFAMLGKRVCARHGAKSTGPRTDAGKRKCAAVRTVHGRETQAMRKERRHAVAQLALLEKIGFAVGMLTGTRTRGRKPALMDEAYPELQEILRQIPGIVRPK